MRVENGKLILEMRKCWQCDGTLRVNDWVTCPVCNGTGKKDPSKPKGKNCPNCSRSGSYDRGRILAIACKDCNCASTAIPGFQPETICDSQPGDLIWQSLPFKVYRSDRHQTIGEYLLGHGCAWSTTDYGRHKQVSDDVLIAECRNHTYIQATKFAKDDGTIADHIGIFCNDNGYSVKAVFGDPAKIVNDFERGLTVTTTEYDYEHRQNTRSIDRTQARAIHLDSLGFPTSRPWTDTDHARFKAASDQWDATHDAHGWPLVPSAVFPG